MESILSIEALAEVIRLAVAPVFLIAGIAGVLNVLSARLGRIIDRARFIELKVVQAHSEKQTLLRAEAAALWSRVRLTFWAIRLCVASALMVSFVIVALFIGDLSALNLAALVAILFITAMFFLIGGLGCFLREVGISARGTRNDMEVIIQGDS